MKTRIFKYLGGAFAVNILLTSTLFSQGMNKLSSGKITNESISSNYSYKIYTAPNNAYGYDILLNEKPIFHAFILMTVSPEGERVFADKSQTEKAAKLSILKMEKGILPKLNEREIRKVMAQ
ncbi:MAG: hypothetical protein ACTHJ5_09800 [Ilyomonas sp.]